MTQDTRHEIRLLIDEKVLQHLEAELYEHWGEKPFPIWLLLTYTICRDIRHGEAGPTVASLCDFNEQFAELFGEPAEVNGEYPWSKSNEQHRTEAAGA